MGTRTVYLTSGVLDWEQGSPDIKRRCSVGTTVGLSKLTSGVLD